ncbi:hypothetical protein MKZ38_004071 [Zalerion maritima]|uniref:SET domain-containing protein n=1 Tax=Zalerion maritima TaxID=339359 RepID=A0AAD5RWK2_9PEZI|nr:hypothetical protein MKZ38_004071 [Zalerion maritima]
MSNIEKVIREAHLSPEKNDSCPDFATIICQEHPGAGRGVFAKEVIAANTTILKSKIVLAYLVFQPHQRNCCAYCFRYGPDELPISDMGSRQFFCNSQCRTGWQDYVGPEGKSTWDAVETFKQSKAQIQQNGPRPTAINPGSDDTAERPSGSEIGAAWEAAFDDASSIRQARLGSSTGTTQIAMEKVMSTPANFDIICLQISTIIMRARQPQYWSLLLQLAAEDRPYRSHDQLNEHVISYLQLLANLPTSLLGYVTPDTCIELAKRLFVNCFSIGRSPDDDNELGCVLMLEASLFNHACAPNVAMVRDGRARYFMTARKIECSEELTISYIGERGSSMGREERRGILKKTWGFECRCGKCQAGSDASS